MFRSGEDDELRIFIPANVGDDRWGPPLVDEDWQAIHKDNKNSAKVAFQVCGNR